MNLDMKVMKDIAKDVKQYAQISKACELCSIHNCLFPITLV